MLKRTLVAWLCVGLSTTGLAQGYFSFSNRDVTVGITAPVSDAQGVRLSGSDYLAMLYVGPTQTSLEPVWEVFTVRAAVQPFRTGAAAGYIAPVVVEARNVVGNSIVWVQMLAWDARLGSTYAEARQLGLGGYGESLLFQTRIGSTDSAGVPIPTSLLGLQPFALRAMIPEPRTFLLLCSSLPVLWLATRFRRKGDDSTKTGGNPWTGE